MPGRRPNATPPRDASGSAPRDAALLQPVTAPCRRRRGALPLALQTSGEASRAAAWRQLLRAEWPIRAAAARHRPRDAPAAVPRLDGAGARQSRQARLPPAPHPPSPPRRRRARRSAAETAPRCSCRRDAAEMSPRCSCRRDAAEMSPRHGAATGLSAGPALGCDACAWRRLKSWTRRAQARATRASSSTSALASRRWGRCATRSGRGASR